MVVCTLQIFAWVGQRLLTLFRHGLDFAKRFYVGIFSSLFILSFINGITKSASPYYTDPFIMRRQFLPQKKRAHTCRAGVSFTSFPRDVLYRLILHMNIHLLLCSSRGEMVQRYVIELWEGLAWASPVQDRSHWRSSTYCRRVWWGRKWCAAAPESRRCAWVSVMIWEENISSQKISSILATIYANQTTCISYSFLTCTVLPWVFTFIFSLLLLELLTCPLSNTSFNKQYSFLSLC